MNQLLSQCVHDTMERRLFFWLTKGIKNKQKKIEKKFLLRRTSFFIGDAYGIQICKHFKILYIEKLLYLLTFS